jgi:two-component system OmpR family sensor kinase
VLGSLSLRTRLMLGVIGVAAVGLVAADLATYSSLRSFLFDRTQASLDDAHQAVEFALGRGPGLDHGPHDDGNADFGGRDGPRLGPLTSAVRGYYVQVRRANGSILFGGSATQLSGAEPASPPRLPAALALPATVDGAGESTRYFTVPAKSGGGRYRVRAWTTPTSPYTFVLAAPLASVDGTLHRLLFVELLVTALVLGALAVLGLWVVRLGLRPLEAIGETAAKIADGDLSQRVERSDERTEVGRLGVALNRMLAQIEAGYRAREASERKLRRFVADASHELRTPLAAVRAYAELFGRGAAEHPEDLERSMKGIDRESRRMSVLVEDLLLLARLDEGRPLQAEPVRMDDLVRESVDAAHALDPERPVDVDVDTGAVVVGDRDRLRQVVDNLLANVRAHTPPGTPARATVRRRDGLVVLEVGDDGPGLDDDQLGHVFERFYRTDASRARSSGGVGLGLSIVAAVAAAHRGKASAHAAAGGGAVFRVELPAADAVADASPTASTGAAPRPFTPS